MVRPTKNVKDLHEGSHTQDYTYNMSMYIFLRRIHGKGLYNICSFSSTENLATCDSLSTRINWNVHFSYMIFDISSFFIEVGYNLFCNYTYTEKVQVGYCMMVLPQHTIPYLWFIQWSVLFCIRYILIYGSEKCCTCLLLHLCWVYKRDSRPSGTYIMIKI